MSASTSHANLEFLETLSFEGQLLRIRQDIKNNQHDHYPDMPNTKESCELQCEAKDKTYDAQYEDQDSLSRLIAPIEM